MTDHTTDPSTRTAEDQTRALDVIVDIAKGRCEQSGHECDWECSLLERSIEAVKAELNRSKLLRSAKDHAVEQSDKHARRLIEWREAAEKATRERDAYAKAENDERFQLAAAEAREERDVALARLAELEGQLAKVRENQLGFARGFLHDAKTQRQRAGNAKWNVGHIAARAEGAAHGAVQALQMLLMELGEVEYDEAAETTWDIVTGEGASDEE